jgi:hypothetical protein
MSYPSNPKAPVSSPEPAKRHRLLLGAGILVVVAASGMLWLEPEYRNKLLGLWPLLIFVPIPLLTWLNSRRKNAESPSGMQTEGARQKHVKERLRSP